MINQFEIIGFDSQRPEAERIIFCDGTGGNLYRAETDLELSHWRPNRTPPEFRAGTSTEICFRFLDHPRPGSWTAAVNNHVDVDGILSVYVLLESDYATTHRRTIIEAAEMGDFWGWGEAAAQRLFQGITRLMRQEPGMNPRATYAAAFSRIAGLIDGTDPEISEIDESLAALRQGVELVESGKIRSSPIDNRLVHYVVPLDIARDDDERASYAPGFNEAISTKAILWPHVRARYHADRVCLVSVERNRGWFHDLCFPGYLWADTEERWLVTGMNYHDGMASYDIKNDRLLAAMNELQQQETAVGRWGLGGTNMPFGEALQERFPVVGRFLGDQGGSAASNLKPDQVARALEDVFG